MNEDKKEEIMPTSSMVTITAGASINEIAQRARIIDELYKRVMKRDIHYGVIPGTGADKPSLLKAGAEKLMATFNLGSELAIEKTILPEGHREYQITVNIKHYPTGKFIGSGVGVCSTMESKYRYRNVADFDVTGEVIPRDYKERKQEYRKKGFGAKKIDGEWQWVKFGDSERSENPDIADIYNTCVKMAKKRALVDAVLTATGASDIFTQDVEDFADLGVKTAVADDDIQKDEPKTTVKRMKVVEGIEVWDVSIGDVKEQRTETGAIYYIIEFDNGKSVGTVDKELAERAAETTGQVKVEVRPGRKPGSFILTNLMIPEEAKA